MSQKPEQRDQAHDVQVEQRVTLVDLIAMLGGFAGAVFAWRWGWSWLGWPDAIAGGLLGFVIGLIVGGAGSMAALSSVLWVITWVQRIRLRRHFGKYWISQFDADWDEVVERLQVGEMVSGRVVSVGHTEVVVDVGEKFPAILSRLDLPKKWEPPIAGSEIKWGVLNCDALERVIYLILTEDGTSPSSPQ